MSEEECYNQNVTFLPLSSIYMVFTEMLVHFGELSELQRTLNLFMCHLEMYYNKNQADGAPLPLPCVACSRPWHSRQAETVIVELAMSQFTV